MSRIDFRVRYDPNKDTALDLTKKILYSLFIKRIKGHKPVYCFIGGDSGEGKSITTVTLQKLLYDIQGVDYKDFFEISNIFSPLQYPVKLEKILFEKEFKKANIITVHEARDLVKAKNWQSFLSTTIADVNAMSRSQKRLIFFIISQFIKDITKEVRYTLTYYCKVSRPIGGNARLVINKMWKDDRDLEQPKLRKRRIKGYLVYPNGVHRSYSPQYFELPKPDKEIVKEFERLDKEAKAGSIRSKLNTLISEMRMEIEGEQDRVTGLVNHFAENVESLHTIGKRWRGKWKVKKEAVEAFNLEKKDLKVFESKLNAKLKTMGYMSEDEES